MRHSFGFCAGIFHNIPLSKNTCFQTNLFVQDASDASKTLPPIFPWPATTPRTSILPASICLLAVNRNTRARCEICLKLTINTPEQCHWQRSGVFIVNFEHRIAGWVTTAWLF